MPPSTTPSRTMLVYRRELIARTGGLRRPRARIFCNGRAAAAGYILGYCAPGVPVVTKFYGAAAGRSARVSVRHRRLLLPADAIAIGDRLSVPKTFRSIADDARRHQFVIQAGLAATTSSTSGRAAMPRGKLTHL